MFERETYFTKLPAILRRMEEVAGRSFADLIDESGADPMTYMASLIARAHDGEGYVYGRHSDNALAAARENGLCAIRMKDGNGLLVEPAVCDEFDMARPIKDLTPLELALFATDVKTSVNGFYMLVRYDLIAGYANPFLTTQNSFWEFAEGVMCECRSAVVDLRDMSIASLPYYKFRNLDECDDYGTDRVRAALSEVGGRLVATEKLDGSMIQMRYVGDEEAFEHGLLYSTSGTLAGSAGAEGNGHIEALRRLHLEGAELDRHLAVAKAHPELTLIYEFVHPDEDRHVVFYGEDRRGLYLTGARDVHTGRLAGHAEVCAIAGEFGIPVPAVMATDLDEALAIKRDGDGAACEGMVVNIGDGAEGSGGWLVKVKLDGFLALSHIHHEIEGAAGFKSICRMVNEGTLDDAMPALPGPLREYVEAVAARLEGFDGSMRTVVDGLVAKGLEASDGGRDRKAYALYVNGLACPAQWKGWLFQCAYGNGVKRFWCDEKGDGWRYLAQSEFEEREAALEGYLAG